MSAAGRASVLFICERPLPDPVLARAAEELGETVVHARSAAAGLEQARHHDFALMLVGYAGDEAALGATIRQVRATRRSVPTPVVALGVPAGAPFPVEPLYEAGAVAVLTEPLSPVILRAKMRFYIDAFEATAERRRAEAELAEANRVKTEFLATLAHELRNPLAPLRSGLQFIRRKPGESDTAADPAAVARIHDIMDRQLGHLVHLVDDLLDVARITRGQIALKRERIDLGGVLAAAAEISMPLVEAARHHLDVRMPQQPLVLDADATRLTQVVSNLLNNAARYTPRGGSIVLAAERDGDEAVIAVSDNGIGIDPARLDEAFTMFTQIGEGRRHAAGGLGIGLSLVRSLVELHGGSVRASSAGTNAGSVFTVRLPLATQQTLAETAAAADSAPTRQPARRVLVVDDNRDAAETLSAVLGQLGHQALVANDGHQALRMMAGFGPDVVFLDLGMPGMSGYEVADAIRRDARHAGVRLVALTGWGGEADRERTARAGFDRHLTKPATMAAIEEVLAG